MVVQLQFKRKSLLFKNPLSVISAYDAVSLKTCFDEMERALASGYYLAGFLSYEAGYAFEQRLTHDKRHDFPLLYMGVYKTPVSAILPAKAPRQTTNLKNIRLNVPYERYRADIAAIRAYIASGDVYQITYCIKLIFDFSGDPYHLYGRLSAQQPVPYPAYVETDDFHIISLSPEKFMKKRAGRIVTKPMKGTWPRGNTFFSDRIARTRFARDEKNRAENVMIADLLRNDLGRVATGVAAPRLFEVTGYRTLYQMTSTITASIPEDILLYRLFSALFPSGSVTGAPKIRAMEIIRELEQEERRIYTGAIGYITPKRDLFFNIPIRTLLIRNGCGEMGVGGGIVWDSTPLGEWEEGLLKARFVTDLYGGPCS